MVSLGLAITLVALVSGDITKQGNEFNYVVSIQREGGFRSFLCAGSLIASRWVLTAAHCLTEMAVRIRYSNTSNVLDYSYSAILQRIRHMNTRSCYSSLDDRSPLSPRANNIGLALVEAVSSPNYARLSAIDYLALLGHEVKFMQFNFNTTLRAKVKLVSRRMSKIERQRGKGVGFGAIKRPWVDKKSQDREVNDSLPQGTGYKVGTGVVMMCQDKEFPGPTVCVVQKCIGSQEPVVSDYGGPLTHDGSIVGVSTEVEDSYSMYTPVSPFLEWINMVIAENG
ncbi:hypothetical protein B5X24_HaOG211494 [Helicoverpa armigera]|nr:hypothetical protein B5X24_HaOG211494 [Helicoverpa armigera]